MHTHRFASSFALALIVVACADPSAPGRLPEGSPGSPIINGDFDGNAHPAGGALLYDFDNNGITSADLLCSGSLIAPTVFLTARHCLDFVPAGSQFFVTFDNNLLDNGGVFATIASTSYAFNQALGFPFANDIRDAGVVILPAGSTSGITPVQLPALGALDAMAARGTQRNQFFEAVGYGVSVTVTGLPQSSWDGRRNTALERFMSLTPYQLGLSMNSHATGQGGDCHGDSGSPKFVPGTNTIVAVTSWGDIPCRATSWNYRLDTAGARQFLASYVPLA